MSNYATPTKYASPPPPLQQAIDQASSQYGVPPDLEVGIWHVESASTFPNPFVNKEGYGGLFGTSNWDASTQAQANESAQILANTLRASGGNIASALSAYSGGGYTSVPGETTFGNITVPANPGPIGTGGTVNPNSTLPGGTATTLFSSPVSAIFGGIESDISGSIEEAFLRFGELLLALILGYIALKSLNRYFGAARGAAGPAVSLVAAPAKAGYSTGQAAYGVATTGVMTA